MTSKTVGPLTEIGDEAFEIAQSKGWWPDDVLRHTREFDSRQIATTLCLLHREVSEALEAVRVGDVEHFTEELADVLIYTLNLAAALQLDMDAAVSEKMAKNRGRKHRHGGKSI